MDKICLVYLDIHFFLVSRIGGEEHNFCKATMRKRSITNSANNFVSSFNNGEGLGVVVINKASDILPGHVGQLLLEEGFQTG
jgi:hypothetical protein